MAVSLLDLAPPGQPWLTSGGAASRGGVWQPWAPSPGYGTTLGRGPQYGTTQSAEQQLTDVARRRREAESAWNASNTAWNAGNAGWTATGNTSPFTAETLTRNPELAAILQRLYGQIGSLSTDPNVNQTVLQRNTRLPEVERAGQAALTTQQADANNNAQSIADFTRTWLAAQPAQEARANAQADTIQTQIYGGGYEGALADVRRRLGVTGTQNYQRAVGNVVNRLSASELGAGGVSNSNVRAGAAGEAGRLRLMLDEQLANLERTDLGDVLNRQVGAAGLPQSVIDAALQRQLVPIQAGQASAAADLNRLQGVTGVLQNNNVITPQSQSSMIQQIQQLLSGQASIDPAANYRYVQGNFPDSYPGMAPQSRLRLPNVDVGGGGGSFDDLLATYNQQGAQPSFSPTVTAGNFSGFPSYNAAVSGDPTSQAQSGALENRRRALLQSYASMGYDPNAIMNWLSSLSPEQLAQVPMGGYE